MKLKLNLDYARRHLFVVVLMAVLACWFGYDGFVRYPATPAAELYQSIEGSAPPESMSIEALEKFKEQKTKTQYGFCLLAALASLIVGVRLARARAFDFSFDEAGFAVAGRRYGWGDIAACDRTRWEKKGILVLALKDGRRVVLDAWHHLGVKDFEKKLTSK